MILADVIRFEFSKNALEEAYEFLRKAGEKRFEAVTLFAGKIEGQVAHITDAVIPYQTSYKTLHGLMYHVEGKELHRINKWLYENKLLLFAQIHSHPTEAYHSEMDDEFTIVSTIGGLSIVVPFFAKSKLNHHQWAFYRLNKTGEWEDIGEKGIDKLIKII